MTKEYANYVNELALHHPELAGEISGWHGLTSVLDWMKEKALPPGTIDLIGQDEFESDFLIELEPAGRWLAFGVT